MALLKQSRAVGLGCILATQNPADLDYKRLTNTGTWFIGRLQTERDKARVMEGPKGAIAESGGDSQRADYDRIIGGLRLRTFLMHNIHGDGPVVFQTRWVMCYLHGPLTRPQIRALTAGRVDQDRASTEGAITPSALTPRSETMIKDRKPPAGFSTGRQVLEPEISQLFLPLTVDETGVVVDFLGQLAHRSVEIRQVHLIYEPAILGAGRIRFFNRERGISDQRERLLLGPAPDQFGSVDWDRARELSLHLRTLEIQPAQTAPGRGPFFAPAPEAANSAPEFKRITREFEDWLYYNSQLTLLSHPELKVTQRPGETERGFKTRLRQAARERRDEEVDRLRARYERELEKLESRLRREQRELEGDASEYSGRRRESLIAADEMLLTLFGRRRLYRTASWTASRRRLAQRAKLELEETRAEIEELEADLNELHAKLEAEIARITSKWVDLLKALAPQVLHPRRSDVEVTLVGLAWVPAWVITYADGDQTLSAKLPAFLTSKRLR